ncbi:UDP-N-acetylmuramate--L-alanine ligase [bacterium]|nr:UDP-N-acetylmuramate--L-alanine ligase [bacterium]
MGKYHFIAIGGIGMSGLAKYLLEDGHTVTGSDISDSKYIDKLKELGATVTIGHSADNVPDGAIVVVSSAIRQNNPELVRANEMGLKIYHRSDMLREIAEMAQKGIEKKCFIGFSGTHGKTTTSGLASYVLEKADLKPSFVDGGIVPELNTNAQHKSGKYFIAELDESDGTIIKYSPDILVINNIEEDHLDFYKNGMSDLIKTFEQEISKSEKVLVNNDNNGVRKLSGNFITFGLNNADYMAKNIIYSKEFTSFDFYYREKLLANIIIQVAGIHNVYNALAVATAFCEAGINIDEVKSYFKDFTGMGRRFQKVCEINGIQVYDDYAHHPTEIKATLDAAAQKFGKANVVAVFQPHRYTRLKSLWEDFKSSFDNAGRLIVTDVYAASEDPIEEINSARFVSELKRAEYYSGSIEEVAKKLLPTLDKKNVVIGLGAGTITNLGKSLQKFVLV